MATYELTSRWHVDVSRERLWGVLEDGLADADPMPWWPRVETIGRGADDLVLRARSNLGYALTFRLHGLVTSPPDRMWFEADGDLRGRGVLTFVEVDDRRSVLDIRWNVDADRAWMRVTRPLLRPMFVAAHGRLMRDGERRLNAWLAAP